MAPPTPAWCCSRGSAPTAFASSATTRASRAGSWGEPAGRAGPLLGPARPPGPDPGEGGEALRRGLGRLLREQAARQPDRSRHLARRAARSSATSSTAATRSSRRSWRATPSPALPLGRLPGQSPRRSSSGRVARAACTTASATCGRRTAAGRSAVGPAHPLGQAVADQVPGLVEDHHRADLDRPDLGTGDLGRPIDGLVEVLDVQHEEASELLLGRANARSVTERSPLT